MDKFLKITLLVVATAILAVMLAVYLFEPPSWGGF